MESISAAEDLSGPSPVDRAGVYDGRLLLAGRISANVDLRRNSEARDLAACLAVVFLAILATWPLGDMAYIDDWSYAFMALKASQTGHLTYNGWSAPMLGIQAFWGAGWIRLFGFSFNILRLSILPFVAGCTVLLHRLFRRSGLTRQLAVFGVIGMMVSPLTLPLEVSFMSDIPALFFLLLCFWCCQGVIEAKRYRTFLGWSVLLFVSGLVGGTIRQTDWLAPFVIFPVLARGMPKSRRWALWSFWLAGSAGATAMNYWLVSQPYYYSLPLLNTSGWLFPAVTIVLNTNTLMLELVALMFPILCLALRLKTRLPRPSVWIAVVAFFALTIVTSLLLTRVRPPQLIAGNIITQWGILVPGTEIAGRKPVVLAYPLQVLIVAAAMVSFVMLLVACCRSGLISPGRLSQVSSPVFIGPFLLFACIYLVSVMTRALTRSAFDRYLIPVFPLAILLALMAIQKLEIRSLSTLSISSLVLFTFWGVGVTHDYFAELRARLEAANEVLRAGVSRQQISGGLEFDAWTELLISGHIPRVQPGRARPPFWFRPYTPGVKPRYVLSLSPLDDLRDSEFAPVPYRNWLPPFARSILIEKQDRR